MKTNNAVKFLGALGVATATTLIGAGEASAVQIFNLDTFDDPATNQTVQDNDADGTPVVGSPVSLTTGTTSSEYLPLTRTLTVDTVVEASDDQFDPAAIVAGGFLDLLLSSSGEATFNVTYKPEAPETTFDLLGGASMMQTDLIVTLDITESPDEFVPVTLSITDADGDEASVIKNVDAVAGATTVAFDFANDFPLDTFGMGAGEVDLTQTEHFDLFFNLSGSALQGSDVQLNQIHTEVGEPVPFEAETSAGLALLVGYGAWRRWKSRRA